MATYWVLFHAIGLLQYYVDLHAEFCAVPESGAGDPFGSVEASSAEAPGSSVLMIDMASYRGFAEIGKQ